MNDTRDPEFSRLYRDASAEAPPPALGQDLRAAAAAAVTGSTISSSPRTAKTAPATRAARRWGAPLALAASVVLGLGIVLRVAVERPDMRPPAAEPVVASAPAKPAEQLQKQVQAKPDAATGNVADPGAPDVLAAEKVLRQVSPDAMKKSADTASRAATAERERVVAQEMFSAKENSAARSASAAGPEMPAAPVAQAKMRALADTAPEPMAPARASPPAPGALAVVPPPAAAVPSAPPASAPSPAAASPAPAAASSPPAAAQTSDAMRVARDGAGAVLGAAPAPAPKLAERRRAEPFSTDLTQRTIEEEKTLLPADWIKRIVELRRAGRAADADASLRRFVERHPGYAVPEAARGP